MNLDLTVQNLAMYTEMLQQYKAHSLEYKQTNNINKLKNKAKWLIFH
jgi:hypothetical protein